MQSLSDEMRRHFSTNYSSSWSERSRCSTEVSAEFLFKVIIPCVWFEAHPRRIFYPPQAQSLSWGACMLDHTMIQDTSMLQSLQGLPQIFLCHYASSTKSKETAQKERALIWNHPREHPSLDIWIVMPVGEALYPLQPICKCLASCRLLRRKALLPNPEIKTGC